MPIRLVEPSGRSTSSQPCSQRQLILRNLIALWQVGIVIVLRARTAVSLMLQWARGQFNRRFDCNTIDHRQRAGHCKTNGTGACWVVRQHSLWHNGRTSSIALIPEHGLPYHNEFIACSHQNTDYSWNVEVLLDVNNGSQYQQIYGCRLQ